MLAEGLSWCYPGYNLPDYLMTLPDHGSCCLYLKSTIAYKNLFKPHSQKCSVALHVRSRFDLINYSHCVWSCA